MVGGTPEAKATTNGRFQPIEGVSQCPNPLGQASWDARFSPLAPDGGHGTGRTHPPESLLFGR